MKPNHRFYQAVNKCRWWCYGFLLFEEASESSWLQGHFRFINCCTYTCIVRAIEMPPLSFTIAGGTGRGNPPPYHR